MISLKMKRLLAFALAVAMLACLAACGNNSESAPTQTAGTEMPATETPTETVQAEPKEENLTVFCDGSAGYKITPEQRDAGYQGEFFFAQYFGEDIAAGIKTLVEKGGVTINGIAIPNLDEMKALGEYVLRVNGVDRCTVTSENVAAAGDEIVAVLADLFKASGTQVNLTVVDGSVTAMGVFYTVGALVDHLEETDSGIIAYSTVKDPFAVTSGFGPMAVTVDVIFPAKNIQNVTDGCIAVCWESTDGWHMQGAEAVKGCLIDGADHEYYVLEDINGNTMTYQDAEMYSRGFSEGSRPGQFTNTQKSFGLEDIEITVWFIPGTVSTDNPMPIGITGLENASARLERAIAYTQNILNNTVVAESEEEAAAKAAEQGIEDYHWVSKAVTVPHVSEITQKDTQGILDMVNAKVADAQAMLDSEETSPAACDQMAYELYITMWGSSSDIGAVFSGTAEEGFYDVADAGANALPAAVLK